MSIVGFIVKGDRTSHGGTVLDCKARWFIDGIPAAGLGDPVWCPRCNRLTKIVTSRFPQFTRNGIAAAFDLDTTDCGAVLYSRHNDHAGYGSADDPVSNLAGAAAKAPRRTGEASVQEHYVLHERESGTGLAGVQFTLNCADGRIIDGETDEHGRTGVVWTGRPEDTEIVLDSTGGAQDDPYHYSETTTEPL